MVSDKKAVRRATRERFLWGYSPSWDWESCCDHFVNFMAIPRVEFERIRRAAIAERAFSCR